MLSADFSSACANIGSRPHMPQLMLPGYTWQQAGADRSYRDPTQASLALPSLPQGNGGSLFLYQHRVKFVVIKRDTFILFYFIFRTD